jgi:hypothetical protein
MGDITKMNDQELLTYTANVRRLVNFKEPPKLPEADVVKFGSGEEMKGKGLEELIEKEGLVASPKTSLGSAQFNIKRAEQEINKVIKENDLDSLLKGFGKDQLSEIRLHNQGLVRAVTRQILSEDIRAGKIKSLDLEKLGTSREPIDYFRKIYGEDALEQLDSIAPEFNRFYTEKEAADFAKTKFKFEPDETRLKGSMSYEELEKNIKKPEPSKEAEILNIGKETDKRKTIDELIDEYNANFDRTKLTDEEGGTAIGYSEFQDLQKRNEEIAKALEEKGIKSTIEEEIKPEGIVIPFRKKFTKPEPEEKADGGRIGYNKGKRVMSSIDKLIEQLNKKTKGKKSMESVDPKTGEVTVPKKPIRRAEEPTGMTTMDPEPEIIDERSITKTKQPIIRTTEDIEKEIDELATTPIITLEGQRKYNDLHLEFINSLDPRKKNKNLDYRRKTLDTENRLILKAEEQGLDYDIFEKLRKGLYGPRKQQTLDFIKTGKVNVEPVKSATTFEEVQKRYGIAAKAADEIFPNYNTPKTAASELANVMAEQKYGKVFDDLSGDIQQELYEEAFDYITSVNRLPKISPPNRLVPPGTEFNISDPKTAEAFTNFAKENDPEGFKKIQKIVDDINNKNMLEDFDIKGREPNASGGIAGLL